MIKIISKLEDNIFSGILVKKGLTCLCESDFKKLKQDKNFISFQNKKFIIIEQKKSKASTPANKTIKAPADFETMNWKDLQAYAKSRGIKAKTKANIIEELKKDKKGE
jgi:hypothetical protein